MDRTARINAIVDKRIQAGNFRHEIYDLIPEGSENLFEYGFGDGSLLLGLARDKGCTGLYGVDVNPGFVRNMDGLFDRAWELDLNAPDADLGEEFHGRFDYIISTMSLEHTYDPWYILAKFRRYLSETGKIIVEIPNVQHWECLYRMLNGDFPYVSGGTWDFSHIRWYTLASFAEIAGKAGLKPLQYYLRFPGPVDLRAASAKKEIRSLSLPPEELDHAAPRFTITFPMDIKPMYALYHAHLIIMELGKSDEEPELRPTRADLSLEAHKLTYDNPCALVPQLLGPPIVPSSIERVKQVIMDRYEHRMRRRAKG